MRRQINGSLFVCATALALAACASNPAANTSGSASPGAEALAAVAADSSSPSAAPLGTPAAKEKTIRPGNGYRIGHKNGEEYYCQKQPVLGSRAKVIESCLTLAGLTKMRESGQDVMQRTQGRPGSQQGIDSNGGMNNSAVNNPNAQQ